MSSITIKNDDTSQAKKGADQGNEAALVSACIKVEAQAKSLAPVDKGGLRSSIGYKTATKSSGSLDVSPKDNEGFVGTNVFYGIYQEFGTRFMAPQPFLRPAAQILKGGKAQIMAEMQRNMAQHLNTFKGKGNF